MTFVHCTCKDCKHCVDNYCDKETLFISDESLGSFGFEPICTAHEEEVKDDQRRSD